MSKYYKAEDVIRKRAEDLADTSYWEYGNPKNVDEWIEVAEMEFKDLPTIEVNEGDLYIPLNNQTVKRINRLHKDECGEYFDEEWLFSELEQISEFREVSEDCISREWIISFIDAGHLRNPNEKCYSENDVVELIKNAPSVVPSRAEGEWVHLAGIGYRCSNCNEYTKSEKPFHKPKGDYCPNCGAKMKGASDGR